MLSAWNVRSRDRRYSTPKNAVTGQIDPSVQPKKETRWDKEHPHYWIAEKHSFMSPEAGTHCKTCRKRLLFYLAVLAWKDMDRLWQATGNLLQLVFFVEWLSQSEACLRRL